MKKVRALFLGLFALCTLGLGCAFANPIQVAHAEPDIVEPEKECHVVINEVTHGEIAASIEDGDVGDICTLTVDCDLFYIVDSITVNDVALVESEETRGVYSFALVSGDNVVTAKLVVDNELLGDLAILYEQASNKDWKNLFSVDNVLRIVSWLIEGGLLIAIVRYFVKDKKLAKQIEGAVTKALQKIIPEQTKQYVLDAVQEIIKPLIAQLIEDGVETKTAISVVCKCFALAQQNTPDSKRAILDELATINISDKTTIASVKEYIEAALAKHDALVREEIAKLSEIKSNAAKVIESAKEPEEVKPLIEEPKDNGTQSY